MSDQRRVYRVADIGNNTVDVRFTGGALSGVATDLSILGIGATFTIPAGSNDIPLIGDEVRLTLTADRIEDPVTFDARAVRRSDIGADTTSYGFEFLDPADLDQPELHGLFNRRSTIRVEPSPDEPVEVVIRTANRSVPAVMRDVSVSGIGLEAAAESEGEIGATNDVRLRVTFGPDDEVDLSATIRSRRLTDGSLIVYGLIFVEPLDEASALRRVRQYVMNRQRDLLKNRPDVDRHRGA